MDTVILAAGKGSRLDGITAPFHKPLLVVNGQPLVRQCVERAAAATDGAIIVVVAPENAAPIAHVLNGAKLNRVDIIVQREPKGPGHALLTGMKLVTTAQTLVLLGDNVISQDDVNKVINGYGGNRNVIGVTEMLASEAQQFTRLRRTNDGLRWVEKVPVADADVQDNGNAICWVGPVVVDSMEMEKAIRADIASGGTVGREIPIGPLFNKLPDFGTVTVTSIDIGSPEAL